VAKFFQSNFINVDKESNGTVNVSFVDAPVITQGPGNIEAIQSQEYVLKCKARGVPDPKYKFFKVSSSVFCTFH